MQPSTSGPLSASTLRGATTGSADAPSYGLRSYGIRSTVDLVGLRRTNDPALLILTSLAGGPKHGHALAKDIEQFAGVTLGPGTLYGAITRLEEGGLIEPLDDDSRRRPYRLTPDGSAALAVVVDDLRRIVDTGTTRLRARLA